jgi:aminopeptidase
MYTLDKNLLTNYAKVMVQFALNNGNGIKKGETVLLVGHEYAKDLFLEIAREIWKAGGNVIPRFLPNETSAEGFNKSLLELGSDEQLGFFPTAFWQGVTDAMDHMIFIISEVDIHALEGIDAKKVSLFDSSRAPFMEMRNAKERQGKFSWTICLYGTESMAAEAGLNIEQYWEQIIEACYLRDQDPVAIWKKVQGEIETVRQKLTALQIDKLHVEGPGVDLHLTIGKHRKWQGGSGANIPSFEVFTSPDWRGTNGTISFNQPLYYSGKRVSGISLEFKDGVVVKATATENQDTLKEMITQENADKVGEFSLTDKRYSRITHFMAETLYDENMGGAFGNTHIALGMSYEDTFDGDKSVPSEKEWEDMGFNNCPKVHTDIISTTDRTVTATLPDGSTRIIYTNGQFTLD